MFLDNVGDVNVCDTFAFKIARFQTNGTADPEVGGTLPTLGGFNNPFGVAYAPNGDLFVSDMYNQRIQKRHNGVWTATGKFGSQPGNMQMPRGITVTPDGNTVVLTNSEDNRVDLFNTSDLSFIKSIKPTGSTFNWSRTRRARRHDVLGGRHLQQPGAAPQRRPAASCHHHRWRCRGASPSTPTSFTSPTAAQQDPALHKNGTGMTVLAADGQPAVEHGDCRRQALHRRRQQRPGRGPYPGQFGITTFGSDGTCTNCLSAPRSVAIDTSAGTVAVADFNNNRISIWNL